MQTIMIVDDEADVADTVAMILESNGFKTIKANNGRACLKKLEKNKLDLILLDIMMPDMAGYEVIEKMNSKKRNAKIMLLSAISVTEEEKKKAIKGNVIGFIEKPFDMEDLVKRVKEALGSP